MARNGALHHPTGRLFTRADVTAALRGPCRPRTVRFQVDGETVEMSGCVAEVVSRVGGETIAMFFTDHHRDYWLSRAPRPAPRPTAGTGAQAPTPPT